MFARLILAGVLLVALTGCISSSAAPRGRLIAQVTETPAVDRIVIDPKAVRRRIPATFFGINYVGFWEPAEGSVAAARALAQTPIKEVRFPGGVPADWYDWQDPYYRHNSRTSPLQLWHWARSFGATHVLFQSNFQGHLPRPPGKQYAVNSPENAAAWVLYNRRHGIAADMEVGNEEDLALMHEVEDPAYTSYITGFNAQARAMHHVNPGVRVLGPVGTDEWDSWGYGGLDMFLHGTGNRSGTGQVNGVSLHFYHGHDWNDSKAIAQYWLSPDGPWSTIQKTIRNNDTRRLPVYITEWNLGDSDFHNAFNPTLGHALAVTDTIGAFALSGVASFDYFDLHRSDGWGLLYGTNDVRRLDSPMPTYYAMALWNHMGTRMAVLHQSDNASSVVSSYATTGKNGSLQVLMINKRAVARPVRIELQGATPAGHVLHVYSLKGVDGTVGTANAVYDGVKMPSPQHRLPGPIQLGTVHGSSISYTVPGYSAVILALDGATPSPRRRWKNPLPAPHVSPLVVSASGGVGRERLAPGESQTLKAFVRSTDDIGHVLVDLEIRDSFGTNVFQTTQKVDLPGGRLVAVTRPYKIPIGVYGGQYRLSVGVFDPNWSPLYAWNDKAATFTVDAPAPPIVSVTGKVDSSHFNGGDIATFTASVSAAQNRLPSNIAEFDVYNDSGIKVWGSHIDGMEIPRDGKGGSTVHWTIPTDLASGVYVLKVGVFGSPNWQPLYRWNDGAAIFAVGNAHVPANTLFQRVGGFVDRLHAIGLRGYHFLRRFYFRHRPQ